MGDVGESIGDVEKCWGRCEKRRCGRGEWGVENEAGFFGLTNSTAVLGHLSLTAKASFLKMMFFFSQKD